MCRGMVHRLLSPCHGLPMCTLKIVPKNSVAGERLQRGGKRRPQPSGWNAGAASFSEHAPVAGARSENAVTRPPFLSEVARMATCVCLRRLALIASGAFAAPYAAENIPAASIQVMKSIR